MVGTGFGVYHSGGLESSFRLREPSYFGDVGDFCSPADSEGCSKDLLVGI
jgi:hypothetical protein